MQNCETYFFGNNTLPLVIESKKKITSRENFFSKLEKNREWVKKNLLRYGGILFRGFPLKGVDDFAESIKRIGLGVPIDYIGGDSPRIKIKEGVYTSTEAPPSFKIPLHNELSFVKYYPHHIYFFCEEPSLEGGATILGDARKIYQSINPEIRRKFQENGLKYVSHYYKKSFLIDLVNRLGKGHKRWDDVFETESKKDVEKKCIHHEFVYKWLKNDWLEVSQIRPAVTDHPETHEKIWFNQAQLYDFNKRLLGFGKYLGAKILYLRPHTRLHEVFYANGTKIDTKTMNHIHDVLDQETVFFSWQKGDLLILDNILSMHGRAPFKGKRRILTCMTNEI